MPRATWRPLAERTCGIDEWLVYACAGIGTRWTDPLLLRPHCSSIERPTRSSPAAALVLQAGLAGASLVASDLLGYRRCETMTLLLPGGRWRVTETCPRPALGSSAPCGSWPRGFATLHARSDEPLHARYQSGVPVGRPPSAPIPWRCCDSDQHSRNPAAAVVSDLGTGFDLSLYVDARVVDVGLWVPQREDRDRY